MYFYVRILQIDGISIHDEDVHIAEETIKHKRKLKFDLGEFYTFVIK